MERSRHTPLTPRQIEVLELMARGLTNPEIAGVLGISRATVKAHVSAIIASLDVSNRTEAAMALRELGLADAGESSRPVPGFGRRPAIAVLPFDNLSSDPEQDAFADGLVEDLTTRLATVRWFPVIARNSAFAFRETPRDLAEVSRKLDARYLIEGSTRRAGPKVRLHVQAIDAETGHHVFAEKYDREVSDVLAVQDAIVDAVVRALEPALLRLEGLRPRSREGKVEPGAWERCQRGAALMYQSTPESVEAAIQVLGEVTDAEPGHASAWAFLAMSHYAQGLFAIRATQLSSTDGRGLSDSLVRAGAAFQQAAEAGRRATDLDPLDPNGWIGLGAGLAMTGQLEPGRAAFEHAVELNPSSALACWGLGSVLQRFDDWEAALPLFERAIRLSPRDPLLYAFEAGLASALLRARRFEAALAWTRRCVEHEPPGGVSFWPLVPTCLVFLGRLAEARREVAAIRAIRPDFNIQLTQVIATPDVVEMILEAFAKAGWDLRSARDRL